MKHDDHSPEVVTDRLKWWVECNPGHAWVRETAAKHMRTVYGNVERYRDARVRHA